MYDIIIIVCMASMQLWKQMLKKGDQKLYFYAHIELRDGRLFSQKHHSVVIEHLWFI